MSGLVTNTSTNGAKIRDGDMNMAPSEQEKKKETNVIIFMNMPNISRNIYSISSKHDINLVQEPNRYFEEAVLKREPHYPLCLPTPCFSLKDSCMEICFLILLPKPARRN